MALVNCPDCGASVSDAAPTCVKCGRPMPKVQAAAANSAVARGLLLLLFGSGLLYFVMMRACEIAKTGR